MTDESLIHTHLDHYSPSALLRRGPENQSLQIAKAISLLSYEDNSLLSNPESLALTMHHGFYMLDQF